MKKIKTRGAQTKGKAIEITSITHNQVYALQSTVPVSLLKSVSRQTSEFKESALCNPQNYTDWNRQSYRIVNVSYTFVCSIAIRMGRRRRRRRKITKRKRNGRNRDGKAKTNFMAWKPESQNIIQYIYWQIGFTWSHIWR